MASKQQQQLSTIKNKANAKRVGNLQIPLFYRIWYSYFEPASAILAIIIPFNNPHQYLANFVPSTRSPREYGLDWPAGASGSRLGGIADMLLMQTYGLYLVVAFLDLVLVRWAETTPMLDAAGPAARLRIWDLVQWTLVGSDAFYLGSMWRLACLAPESSLEHATGSGVGATLAKTAAAAGLGVGAQSMGGGGETCRVFWSIWKWGLNEYLTVGLTVFGMVGRGLWLARVGFSAQDEGGEAEGKKRKQLGKGVKEGEIGAGMEKED